MNLAATTYAHLFLGSLLVPLMGLDGARGPCLTLCCCTLEILNCSSITNPPRFHQVPLPKPAVHPHPFTYLDFTGNAISSIGKEVWSAYPWAEYLVLKGNHLSRLQNSSLEGLLSLTYLDLSCNKIQIIESNAFEAVPFLQILNLSGNVIEQITEGTFRAWHGMQFLLKVDLSHNPLAVIQDSSFYSLPSLKLLDLGATKVTPKTLEDLLQTSLQLRTLILPEKMSCCLCHIKVDVEVLCETVKLECKESCDINATQCEKEEHLNRMQEEVRKVLEIRKWNGSSLLNILPERAMPYNDAPERAEPNNDTLAQGLGKQVLTTEELLNLLQHRTNRSAEDGQSEITDLHQGDLFETELNKKLTSLIPIAPVRKLISYIIYILKMDCLAPTIHRACSKLVFRSGLLMKLFSGNVNESSSLWKSYFWPPENVTNMTEANSRKLEMPSDKIANHGIPDYRYGNKLLLVISVTAIIMIIIAFICLSEMWSCPSAVKDRTFLGRKKKPLPDEKLSRPPSQLMGNVPLWLKDMYHIQDETEINDMVDQLYDSLPSEEVDRGRWGIARLPEQEPAVKEISSDPSSVPTLELLTAPTATPSPPPPPPTSSPKPSEKKGSDPVGGTSEATSSKAASSAAEEGGDDEDEEGSAEKSDSPTTEATSEALASGEMDEEETELSL